MIRERREYHKKSGYVYSNENADEIEHGAGNLRDLLIKNYKFQDNVII